MAQWTPLESCLPKKTRDDIIYKTQVEGKSYSTVSKELNVSKGAISKYVNIHKETGDIASSNEIAHAVTGKQRQREKKLQQEPARSFLLYNVELDKSLFLREYKTMLKDQLDIDVSTSTIDTFWDDENYSFKKICKMAVEADPYDNYTFFTILNNVTTSMDQLVWGDEAHIDLRDCSRYYGRSPMLSVIFLDILIVHNIIYYNYNETFNLHALL